MQIPRGVSTTIYSIPGCMINLVSRYYRYMEATWKFHNRLGIKSYNCFNQWYYKIKIIGKIYPETMHKLIQNELSGNRNPEYDVWIVNPEDVQFAANDISKATFDSIKQKFNVPDENVNPIPENLYDFYIGDIEKLKKFLQNAADKKKYLLFITS